MFCSSAMDLRFNLDLCQKEKLYRQLRRDRVMLGIKKLLHMEKPSFLPSSPHEVPPIHSLLSKLLLDIQISTTRVELEILKCFSPYISMCVTVYLVGYPLLGLEKMLFGGSLKGPVYEI